MTIADVVNARRREQAALVELARRFAGSLDVALWVRAVVVLGSVARGDFHAGSDIDVRDRGGRAPRTPSRGPRSWARYRPRSRWSPGPKKTGCGLPGPATPYGQSRSREGFGLSGRRSSSPARAKQGYSLQRAREQD
jgi:hypothetical protein